MAFRVKILPRAKTDLESIYRRIVQEAPLQGAKWFIGMEQSIASLSHFPERCPIALSLSSPGNAVRRLLYGNYPHIYRIYFHVVESNR